MCLGEVIGPGARCTVTNYDTTSSYQPRAHVLVLYASVAAARGPGALPALSLLPNPRSGGRWGPRFHGFPPGNPVSMDFPLQLGFPDAQSCSRRERSRPRGTALPGCANAWLSSHLCSCSKGFSLKREGWKGYQKHHGKRNFVLAATGWVGVCQLPAPNSKHPTQ